MNSPRLLYMFLNFSAFIGINSVPDDIKNVLVIQSIENTITAKYYKIMKIRFDSELRYFRLSNYNTITPSILSEFSFYITDCSRDW
jgi:hypothetical protein